MEIRLFFFSPCSRFTFRGKFTPVSCNALGGATLPKEKRMTLREYLAGRKESLKEFCVRKEIPYTRGHRYYYRIGMTVHRADLNKILAETNGMVNADGMTSEKRDKVIYVERGRPPKNSTRRKSKKARGTAA